MDSSSPQRDVKEVTAGLAPLHDGGRLGCVLVQFQWSFKRTAANDGLGQFERN